MPVITGRQRDEFHMMSQLGVLGCDTTRRDFAVIRVRAKYDDPQLPIGGRGLVLLGSEQSGGKRQGGETA
jgi:hypothetical protein